MKTDELIHTVERAKHGNRAAFEKLYSEYYERLYFFVLKNVGKKDAAEDITQEAFLQSMESIRKLEKPETYVTWLHSIAYHKCADLFRQEKRSSYFDSEEEQEQAMELVNLNKPVMLPDDFAENKDVAKKLKALIDGLKPDMRAAVILYYYDDLSVAEVAKSLGMNENAAKQKLFQARKKLKAGIDKLTKGGAVMSAVPVGTMLRRTVSPKYAAGARVITGSSAAVSAFAVKTAGVCAAAVMAVGVPVGLGMLDKEGGDPKGDIRPNSSAIHRIVNESSSAESIPEAELFGGDEMTVPEDSSSQTDDTSSESESETSSQVTVIKLGEEKYSSLAAEATVSIAQSSSSEAGSEEYDELPALFTIDELAGASMDDIIAAAGDRYSISEVYNRFYDDALVLNFDNDPDCSVRVTDGYVDSITMTYSGSISDDIRVGMTNRELAGALGRRVVVRATAGNGNTSWGMTSPYIYDFISDVIIDGRRWLIFYYMEQEDIDEIESRHRLINEGLYPPEEGGDLSEQEPLDISDLDLTSEMMIWFADESEYERFYDQSWKTPEYVAEWNYISERAMG